MSHSYLPLPWSYVSIGSVCEPVQSVNPQKQEDGTFTYIDISSIDNIQKQITQTQIIDNKKAPSRARQLVTVNDILVSTVRPNLNAVALVSNHLDQQICSTGFCVLRPKQDLLDAEYLFFWVQSSNFIENLVSKARGIGYPSVSDSDVKGSNIPLPPLSEQRRIAAILRQANELRQLRRQADERARDLIPALFHEMFGDPSIRERNWPVRKLSELGYVTTGNTPPRSNPSYYGDFIEWIKSDNLDTNHEYLSQSREMLSKAGAKKARIVPQGSTLITCIAGSEVSIGKSRITDRPVTFNQQINAVTPYEDVAPFYLYAAIKLTKPIIQLMANNGLKKIVSKSRLEELTLPYPPKELQDAFEAHALTIIDNQSRQILSATLIDKLWNNLLPSAFNGKLTEIWRETHHKQLNEEAIQRDIALGLRGQEPTIGDLAAGKATTAELEKVNRALAEIAENIQSIQSNVFQDFITKTFGDISKISISSLLASNTQIFQTVQVDIQEMLSSQMAPVSKHLAEQLSSLTQQFQDIHSEMLSKAVFQPLPSLSEQLIDLFSNLAQFGSTAELFSSRKALQDSLSDELIDFINRIMDAPAYFRSDDLIDENISLLQVEDQIRLLKALGIVREVKIRGQMGYRLVSNERDYATPEGLDP